MTKEPEGYATFLSLVEGDGQSICHYAQALERHVVFLGSFRHPFGTRAEDELRKAEHCLMDALNKVREARKTYDAPKTDHLVTAP